MCRNPGQQFSRLPLQATWMHHLRALCIHIYIHRFIHMHFHIYIKHYKALQYKHIRSHIYIRVGNCLVFFLVCFFFGFPVLTIFHAICSILELETAISTVCATVLSSNLSFSIVFSTVFATVCSMFCPFSMLFAAFLSWNLHFHRMCNILQLHSSQYLQDFGAEG